MYVAAVPLIWDESCLKTCAADTKNFGRYIKQALAISSTGSHFQAVMQKVFQGAFRHNVAGRREPAPRAAIMKQQQIILKDRNYYHE